MKQSIMRVPTVVARCLLSIAFATAAISGQSEQLVSELSNSLGTVKTWKRPINERDGKIRFEIKRTGSERLDEVSLDCLVGQPYGREEISTALNDGRFVCLFIGANGVGHIVVIDVESATVVRHELAGRPVLSPCGDRVVYGQFIGRHPPFDASPTPLLIMAVGEPTMPVFEVFRRARDDSEYDPTQRDFTNTHMRLSPSLWTAGSSRVHFFDDFRPEPRTRAGPVSHFWVTIDLADGLDQPRTLLQPLVYETFVEVAKDDYLYFEDIGWMEKGSVEFVLANGARRWRASEGRLVPFDLRRSEQPLDLASIPLEARYWVPLFENDLRPSDDVYKDTEGKLRLKRDKVAADAERMAIDEKNDRYERIWGFQACEQMGIASALPAARRAVQTSPNASLKAAAVGLIGAVGSADDVKLLESVLGSTPTARLQAATEKALCRLKERSSD